RGALNIHMGVSPYYRGNSCNFWPLYDGRPDMVGATIHLLSAGLDSGAILYHALPKAQSIDPFILGMTAVRVAHQSLAEKIASGELADPEPIPQDKSKEVRYTRAADFNDEVATEYLNRMAGGGEIRRAIENRDLDQFVKPYVG
ncbi:MAG: hypothetical protein QGF09_09605, partial [Rhodospirillales bacterium]|nr:hypothetical protein [Rhodospirillales bacterium]